MAGYIGSKTVNLSTTGADIAGDADVSGDLDVGGAFTSQGIDDNATSTAITLDASGNVGIGTSSPTSISGYTGATLNNATNGGFIDLQNNGTTAFRLLTNGSVNNIETRTATPIVFLTNTTERMRIDGAEVYVGHTGGTAPWAMSGSQYGINLMGSGGFIGAARANAEPLLLNRTGSDGAIVSIRKDGSSVGVIGNSGVNIYLAGANSGFKFYSSGFHATNTSGVAVDNSEDIGASNVRWNDAYITNGVTTGSDGNDKQDIRDLTEAEQRVAVACKGLLKAWRWKSAVEEKGDDARIHCGIIAQDLQAAFAAEGLDAGRYAMFMSNTWWETQTEVPAVEAVAEVLDDDGNVVTEAVEAADAYTRTDTYDTQEEAPEGATERTRLGVRYSELLAFIIGAL